MGSSSFVRPGQEAGKPSYYARSLSVFGTVVTLCARSVVHKSAPRWKIANDGVKYWPYRTGEARSVGFASNKIKNQKISRY